MRRNATPQRGYNRCLSKGKMWLMPISFNKSSFLLFAIYALSHGCSAKEHHVVMSSPRNALIPSLPQVSIPEPPPPPPHCSEKPWLDDPAIPVKREVISKICTKSCCLLFFGVWFFCFFVCVVLFFVF